MLGPPNHQQEEPATYTIHGQCLIHHLHTCTYMYAGDFDSVQVTFHNIPAHVLQNFDSKLNSWDQKYTSKSK